MNNKLTYSDTIYRPLYVLLNKLDAKHFKIFFSIFVHYWLNHKCFISDQNFLNLWCELNQFCHETDESFPDQYDDRKEISSFCQAHPYYFIDMLPIDLIAKLFAEYVDNRVDILVKVVNLLLESDLYTVYTFANNALGLCESIEDLVRETYGYIKRYL